MANVLTIMCSIFGRFQWRRVKTRDQFVHRYRNSTIQGPTLQPLLRNSTKLLQTMEVTRKPIFLLQNLITSALQYYYDHFF